MNVKENIIVKLLVYKIEPDALRTLVGQKTCQTMMETQKVIRKFLRKNDVKDSFIKELNGASKTAAIVNPVNNQSTGGIAAYYKARQGAVATAARAEGSVTQPVRFCYNCGENGHPAKMCKRTNQTFCHRCNKDHKFNASSCLWKAPAAAVRTRARSSPRPTLHKGGQ